MNKKTIILLGIALFCGLLAVVLVKSYLKREESKLYQGMNMVPVIAITQDTASGQIITQQLIAKRNVPEKFVHKNAINPKDFELILGQKLQFPMKRGDTLLWNSISADGAQLGKKGFSEIITKGERALTIPIDEIGGVGGFIKPNDHIDILYTVRSEITGEECTITLLQNMTVLATGRSFGGSLEKKQGGGYNTLTLLVTLEEAELLVFAQKRGQISTILRNPEDIDTRQDIPRVNFSDLLKDDYRNSLQQKRNKIQIIKQGRTAQDK